MATQFPRSPLLGRSVNQDKPLRKEPEPLALTRRSCWRHCLSGSFDRDSKRTAVCAGNHEPYVEANHPPDKLERLAAELDQLTGSAKKGRIAWRMSQIAVRRLRRRNHYL